jgi:hypothetical protein
VQDKDVHPVHEVHAMSTRQRLKPCARWPCAGPRRTTGAGRRARRRWR